jgi:surface protein
MFMHAASFTSDLSQWDVSSVTGMNFMFMHAASFTSDISKWDVSSVTGMDNMLFHAVSFKQEPCGVAWINSKARANDMFTGSSGSISRTVCTSTTTAFSSTVEVKGAVDACLKLSLNDNCSNGPHGPIAEWDVSSVTDMSAVFANANPFNGAISNAHSRCLLH